MTRGAALQIRKEARALLPVWMACASALVLVAVVGDARFYLAALLAYGLGAIALGALSVGHEYSGRTLALLLSFPIDRRRVFLLKLAVLSVLLLGLAGSPGSRC
jgi:ABC-type transport system involved in multi-copper enzyme maturation permease subunit